MSEADDIRRGAEEQRVWSEIEYARVYAKYSPAADHADDEELDSHDMEQFSERRERARCLAIASDLLQRGPGFPASKEFADGYSLAAQEIAAEIQRKPATLDEAIAAGRAEYMRITGQ